ncbi:MAG: hypothetical protein ABSB91_05670 [Sedimentisphaerales bacterium]
MSKQQNKAKIIVPEDVCNTELKNIRRVSVMVTSTLPLFGSVAEDQLSLKLRDLGFNLVDRSKLTDVTQKELIKDEARKLEEELKTYKEQLDLEKKLGDEPNSSNDIKRLESRIDQALAQIKKAKEDPQKDALNIADVGRKLGLDAAIVGTIFEGKRQISFSDDKPASTMDKIVVSTFYLQIIDIKTERVLLSITLEYDKGESITTAIDTMTKLIKEQLTS